MIGLPVYRDPVALVLTCYADTRTAFERIMARTEVLASGCIAFTGATSSGYGTIYGEGRTRYVHHIVYEHIYGPIPVGLEVDHVAKRGCVTKRCVNPEHLEAVTHMENSRRAAPLGVSGHRGVHRNGTHWIARIRHQGQDIYLGMFDDIEFAAEVARKARIGLGIPDEGDLESLTADHRATVGHDDSRSRGADTSEVVSSPETGVQRYDSAQGIGATPSKGRS